MEFRPDEQALHAAAATLLLHLPEEPESSEPNLPLIDSENEAARELADIDSKFVIDMASMNPAAASGRGAMGGFAQQADAYNNMTEAQRNLAFGQSSFGQ